MKHNILIVDDDRTLLESTSKFLKNEGFAVRAVDNAAEGIALIRQGIIPFSLALVDFHLGDCKGPEVIREIQTLKPDLTIYGFSGDETDEAHNEALDSGAVSWISKKSSDPKLLGIIHRACREYEKRNKPIELFTNEEKASIIAKLGWAGASAATAAVAELTLRCAPTDAPILIRGPNGTGKELVARAVHTHSPRAKAKFVAVNVAAINKNLIEAELFGYEKGAFTGALQRKIGFFQAANGGTLFLDEIGELPLDLQPILLRVLQEGVVTPVGSTEICKVDFRLIAATNAPLEERITQNLFRQDLFYRLNVLPIILKPLCERPDDIPALATAFFLKSCAAARKDLILLESTVNEMRKMEWPGNVRQLEHVIKRLVLLADNKNIEPEFFRRAYGQEDEPSLPNIDDIELTKINFEQNEKRIIIKALMDARGNQSEAARNIGMPRRTFADKIVKYGIKIKPKGEP